MFLALEATFYIHLHSTFILAWNDPSWSQRLKLKSDETLSNFAFDFYLQRYSTVQTDAPLYDMIFPARPQTLNPKPKP